MNNSYIYVVVLILLASLFSTGSCGTLFAAQADDGNGLALAQKLSGKGFDIYGFYGDLVITSLQPALSLSSEQALNHIQAYCSEVVELGERGDVEEYLVLERQELFGVEFTESLSIQGYSNPLYSSFNRVVVHAKERRFWPDHVEVLPVPTTPIHIGVSDDLLPIVNDVYAHATRKYTAAPVPEIEKLVAAVNADDLRKIVTYLSGEDSSSNILTRNSVSQGAKDAALWIENEFKSFGLTASQIQFRSDYSPNVLGVKLGVTEPSKIVVVGAHYDSRGPTATSPTQRAPGANDNGSGTGAVLHIAKVLQNANFSYTIHFITYSGEEQGLYGSAAYATQLVNEKATVIGVINADMIAYRVPTEATQCAFPSRYSTPALETLAREVVATYVPTLTIGITTACCSDHQSYYNRGFPATGFFERNGAIADPQYHRSEDLVIRTGYDISGQYLQLTKAVLATVATVADLDIGEKS